MNVGEYISSLSDAFEALLPVCDTNKGCGKCPLHKAEGKSCPVLQLLEVRNTLRYAVDNGVHGITESMDISDPMVILLMKRAVLNGYSLYTLRSCNADYIKMRNLLEIGVSNILYIGE